MHYRKKNGSLPDTNSRISVINLTLHSMWDKVSMCINDKEISKQISFYGYKCYMLHKMTYNPDAKNSFLMCSNWSNDNPNYYGPLESNLGLLARAEAFRQGQDVSKPFKSDGTVFMGRLNHDLVDAELPLPSETKINFTLVKAKDEFILMRPVKEDATVDNEDYKFKLLNVSLYVPVGVLSTPMYNTILSRWPTEPIVYHYRPVCITCHTISKGSSQFISPALFPVG